MGEVRAIPVRDPSGKELTVYEFRDRRFLCKVRRLRLCTGELVERIGDGAYLRTGSGERLERIG